ncbi:glycoside hydrolase family 127 protein [Streptomyces sp. 3MP-14]|uniref:Glycoside hydrolase family 127 protein n=1 Tax=Streptomyces mimosae TaxID=2586635 RepID=A0A5N6AS16_9ACTN|nr:MULTISPECIES: beta-L-arabinofuranosidase domain-containing protein [Streptomyces]KAB8170902.1 glycoside hydrolase family 127 protein [Streptomyces mimosae]KAB8179747.1 glycoside hydrolase family 127 protein [Streptomyces sp. 3MP-14]
MPARPGPVLPTATARGALRPADEAVIDGGLWAERRAVNERTSVPDGYQRLVDAGNLHNLRLAAGTTTGSYVNELPFLDSDVYKWLEAVSWQLGDPATDPELAARLDERVTEIVGLLRDAQEPDGYLQSYYQVVRPDRRWQELDWGHELYCAGHLIQAAVARVRATGRTELLEIARKFADHIDSVFGPGRRDAVCGHPEIETALVELFRVTGEPRYLDLARFFVDRRGHGTLPPGRFGAGYWQDHAPVREAEAVTGHAVRQLYLLAGVVDVYAETGDDTLLAAGERLWEEMVARKSYVTGGLGAHHSDEAFGDPFELPSERAYTETCAAIAAVHLSWRLLLATGRARYADHLERVLYNGFLSGVGLDGEHYSYCNPLQVREGHRPDAQGGDHGAFRVRWFTCACCPPNVMRLLASLPHAFAASDGAGGLLVHQYAPGRFAADDLGVRVATDYPWQGRVSVEILEAPSDERALTLRVPHWAGEGWRLSVNGLPQDLAAEEGWLRLARRWQPGDSVVLEVDVAPRLTAPPSRADALRGCVAVERGPLVYCAEAADQPDGTVLDDLRLNAGAPLRDSAETDAPGVAVAVRATGTGRLPAADGWWAYPPHEAASAAERAAGDVELTLIPYHLWGHRDQGTMRVWLPV